MNEKDENLVVQRLLALRTGNWESIKDPRFGNKKIGPLAAQENRPVIFNSIYDTAFADLQRKRATTPPVREITRLIQQDTKNQLRDSERAARQRLSAQNWYTPSPSMPSSNSSYTSRNTANNSPNTPQTRHSWYNNRRPM